MTHEPECVPLTRRNAPGARSRLFRAWLLCASIIQSGCAPVEGSLANDASSSEADLDDDAERERKTFLPLRTDVVTIQQAGPRQALLRATNPGLRDIWSALAQVASAQLSLTLEHGSRVFDPATPYVPYVRVAFQWGAGRTGPFGESGLVPDAVVMETFDAARQEEGDAETQVFTIVGSRFLAALHRLSEVPFDRAFAQNAVSAVIDVAEEQPNSLDDEHYSDLAKFFYATVLPAFSHEIRGDVERSHRLDDAGIIGTAAYALVNGYADLRRWAVRRGLLRPEATLIMTASVVAGILSQSLDLLPDAWSKVAEILCGA